MAHASLDEFPKVPEPGKITLAEYGAQFVSLPCNSERPNDGREFLEQLLNYHQIDGMSLKPVQAYKIPSIRTTDYRQKLIIPRDEGVVKGMWDAWREEGFKGLEQYLQQIPKSPATNAFYGLLWAFCSVSGRLYRLKDETTARFFPHLGLRAQEIIEESSQVRNWQKSWTRAIEWHPHFPKMAIGLQDDTIRIFTVGEEIIPMLRSHEQESISCISWRPHTEVELAVAVEKGVIIWHMHSPFSIKPGGCQTRLLTVKNHSPVTSVEYSSSGLLLLSSSTCDSSVLIWDSSTWDRTPLKRLGGGGVPLAIWSPQEDRILSTSSSPVFRIWERENRWAPRKWKTPNSRVEAACWSPDGSALAFASGGIIYVVHFSLTEIDKFINENDSIATPVFDIAESTIFSENEKLEYKIGGRVRKMDWDPSGNRLAMLFEDSELVAVFRVQHKSTYYLAPCGVIRGFPDEYPVGIAFQKDFRDGALLTIAWNRGRLQYFPFLFAVVNGKNLLHQDYYKTPIAIQQAQQKASNTNTTFMSTGSTFRTTSFVVPPESQDFGYDMSDLSMNFGDEKTESSPRLFSIDGRTPTL